jgi:hypothetical protein
LDRELRRFPRIASQHAVLVTRLGADEKEALTATRSLGLGGCGFLSNESLGAGSLVEVLISVRHEVIRTKAKVAYEIAEADGRCEVGLEFLELADSDRERIMQLLEKDNNEGSA